MSENLAFNFEAPPPLPEEMKERIEDARRSGRLSDCAGDVLDLLVGATGQDRAVQIVHMQASWAHRGGHIWVDRTVKGAVKELIEEHHIPVCSSRNSMTGGYFLAVSTEDLEAAERPLRGEIISLAKRLRAFNPKSDFARRLAGQIALEQGNF